MTKTICNGKNINVDKMLAYIASQREECKRRLTWAKTDKDRGFEEGYDRCLANLAFAIEVATA